jgi:succinoglycan biosynthesis transport protein ExoP
VSEVAACAADLVEIDQNQNLQVAMRREAGSRRPLNNRREEVFLRMLQIANRVRVPEPRESEEFAAAESVRRFLAIARRQLPVILTVFPLGILLAIVYLVTTPTRYTAVATMVIDSNNKLNQQQTIMNDAVVDTTAVETQVEVLRSDNVALSVIKELDLSKDPEFTGPGRGLLAIVVGSFVNLFVPSTASSESELTQKALRAFQGMESVRRNGMTYAISISFTSLSAERAAQIANAIADAYVVDQMDSRFQAAKRAGGWLQSRTAELRGQALAAEKAVQDFKEQNNIVDAGGRLVTEQQVAEVNSQLIMARAQTAEAKAKLDRIEELIKGNGSIPNAAVTDSLRNEVITKLRNEYLQLSNREGLWAMRFGKEHLAVVNLRNQMEELGRSMLNELTRIGETYKSEYEIASARQASLEASLENVVARSQNTKQAQIKLREFQSNAQTYRNLYDTFLQRYMEATQQKSFPITEARLISPASPPNKKSSPSTLIVLAVTMLACGMLGAGIALFREICDRVFRTSGQVERGLQLPCLAMVPTISEARPARRHSEASPGANDQYEASGGGLLAYVVDEPTSRFAESLRALKLAFDHGHSAQKLTAGTAGSAPQGRVIAFTSTLPQEGKSTVAANFARLMARAGVRAILVDADLRQPSLSWQLAPDATAGLVDAVNGNCSVRDAIFVDQLTGLNFLPASGHAQSVAHSSDLISCSTMKRIVESLKKHYSCVIVDLPPLAPVVDVQATATFVDSYVYVIEWGRTTVDVVSHHLGRATNIHDRLLGVILNKTNTKKLNRYEECYDDSSYSRYGYAA